MVKQRAFIGPVQLKVVNFGVDTFIANFKLAGANGKPNGDTLPEHIAVLLDSWQQAARKEHKPIPTPLEYHGKTLFIRPHGKDIWSWMLFNDDVSLTMSYGSMSGGVFCQARFMSHILWAVQAEGCLVDLSAALFDFTAHMIYAQASELHICADIQGWYDFYDGSLDWEDGFVSRVVVMRARPDEPTEREQEGGLSPKEVRMLNEECKQSESVTVCPTPTTTHRRIATLDFGTHGSQIMGQIYNKSEEIKKSNKLFFHPIWRANGWDGQSPITRLEYRIRRDFLHEHELDDAYDTLAQVPLLWEYATQKWLRYVDLDTSEDTNKSRLPTNCVWQVIQSGCTSEKLEAMVDPAGEREARLQHALDEKPLAVLKQAEAISVYEQLQGETCLSEEMIDTLHAVVPTTYARALLSFAFVYTLCEQLILMQLSENDAAIEKTLRDESVDVVRDLAQEGIAKLAPDDIDHMLELFTTPMFAELRPELIKRSRRMAKKKACIAAFAGYLTSIMALTSDEELAGQPNMTASLMIAFEEVQKYNKARGRVHLEEVWKKRLAYGFVMAQQVEAEKKLHGLDLCDEDWKAVQAQLNQLKQNAIDVYVSSSFNDEYAA